MKIHMFIAHMGIGGAERVCINLANEFIRIGHEVHVIVLNLDNDVNTHLLSEKVQVCSLNATRLRYSAIPMLKYVKKHQPSFLFIFGNEMAVILNKLKQIRLINVPLVVRVLNNIDITLSKDDHVSPMVEAYLKKEQKQLGRVNHVIAQCNGMRNMLLEHQLVCSENLTTVYNPVSKELIRKTDLIRIPFKNRNSERTKEIVFIGRIDPQKNLSHLLRAFSIVHQKLPKTVLRLIGEGNVIDEMKRLSQDLQIEDSISFEGVKKDMENIYATADVIALSSEYEGMPNCLIEAIGCGIPIVSYNCPLGPEEIVVNNVNGYLVEYNNVEQLAEYLVRTVSEEWDEEKIKITAEKFDVRNIAEQYINIFRQYTREKNI